MSQRTDIVIFGATGDLARRKLLPGLYNLHRKGRLPAGVRVVGVGRRDWNADRFREVAAEGVRDLAGRSTESADWSRFAELLEYVRVDLGRPEDFRGLDQHLAEGEGRPGNRLYYLSVAPELYEPVVSALGEHGMAKENGGWRRVVVEKPFGRDLATAHSLNEVLHSVFGESQIYRIDHYLGKETAQNVLFFRFGNTVFEPIWNRNYIDQVQITAAETVDVEHRAAFYDSTGVVRDMFQNHLLQLLALVAMEPPASFDADAIRNERVKLLSAVRPVKPSEVADATVRAQYRGYRDSDGVADESQTPTFAALRFWIDNWRWQGVPFYVRSGKALARKTSTISIQFRCPPHLMFPLPEGASIRRNVLDMCIQPDEGVHLRFEAKVPGTVSEMRSVDMEFHYRDGFADVEIPEAYERLLLDALQGDASLFTRSDAIELSWGLMDPILEGWRGPSAPPLELYEPGSWGPEAAAELLRRDGRRWLPGCAEHR
jgi:glucose-6-phosphate 1-dehydrogenase